MLAHPVRCLTIALLTLLAATQPSLHADSQGGQHAQSCLARTLHGKYIVSLGASLSYGFQLEPFLAVVGTPFVPDALFPGAEGAMVRALALRGIQARTMNFSCPGEATDTFVEGGCWWIPAGFPFHDGLTYTGSQLDAVEAFLATHGAEAGLLTFDLGPNDAYALSVECGQTSDPVACMRAGGPAVTARALASWEILLERLRPLAPNAVFLVVVANDVGALLGIPGYSEWWADYKARFVPLLHARGVRTVDMTRQFDTADARLCQLTGFCNARPDVHPNDEGYRVIADMQLRSIAAACEGR